MSKKVVILGAAGRMGQSLIRCILEKKIDGLDLIGAIDLWDADNLGKDVGETLGLEKCNINLTSDLNAIGSQSDVIIDFSSHVSTSGNAERIALWNTAWVIGTTGLDNNELNVINETSKSTPIVISGNMSLGINILCDVIESTAKVLKNKGYDIEICEKHHNQKKDAPSGTALMLGESVASGYKIDLKKSKVDGRSGLIGERKESEIGFHAIRGGDIIGDHSVLFAGTGETLEFTHRATDRNVFALGALEAAKWITKQNPGIYKMKDVLGL